MSLFPELSILHVISYVIAKERKVLMLRIWKQQVPRAVAAGAPNKKAQRNSGITMLERARLN